MINIFSNLSTKNILLLGLLAFFVLFIYILTLVESQGRLNVKSKRVGDGQHGTARFSTKKEIKETALEYGDDRKTAIGFDEFTK